MKATINLALGDSITEGGSILSGAPNYAELIQTVLRGHMFSMVNGGRSGWTTVQLRTLWEDDYRARSFDRLILFAGTNDLASGYSAASTIANLQSIVTDAVSLGMEVVLCTLLPRKNGPAYSTDLQTGLEAVNTWIRAQSIATTVDLYAGLGDEVDPMVLKDTFNSGDYLHPNGAGQAEIKRLILIARPAW